MNLARHVCMSLLIFATTIVGAIFCDDHKQANKHSIIKKVEQHFLSNFDWECEALHADVNCSLGNYLNECLKQQKNMKEISKAKVVFDILSKEKLDTESSIVDITTWDDLNLFRNLKNKKAINVANKIDRSYTYLGKAALYTMLAQPTDNVAVLLKRQSVLKTFIQDDDLYKFLDNKFLQLKQYENLFFSFYSNDVFKNIVNGQLIGNNKLDKNQTALFAKNVFDHQARIILFLAKAAATVTLPIYGISKFAYIDKSANFNTFSERLISSSNALLGILSMVEDPQIQGGISIIAGVNCALSAKNDYQKVCDNFKVLQCLQEKLIHVSAYLNLMAEISEKLISHPSIYNELSVYKINNLFNKLDSQKQELNKLIKLLNTDTFKGTPSVFSNWGKILLAFNLFHELKDEFNEALQVLGKIEAFVSLAKLYKEHESKNVKYSFVNYSKASQPLIELEDFWNPILDETKVITNSISMGGDIRNAIITGINEGGKSTIVKAITINLILAQTIGIAPAKSITITAFSKIGTYINITDDINAGNSLFKSQVLRVLELLKMNKIDKSKFWFIALDEPFNGTAFAVAQATSYALAKNLAKHKNNVCIISTHFPLMAQLESEDESFCNYKVTASVNNYRSANRPFTLQKGFSRQNIAFDILREQGLDNSILDEAAEIIRNQA